MNFSVQSLGAMQAWQTRLARVPKWAWIAFFLGIVLPLVIMGLLFVMIGLIARTVVQVALGVIGMFTGGVRRGLTQPADDGRRNVRVIVQSARVIDE